MLQDKYRHARYLMREAHGERSKSECTAGKVIREIMHDAYGRKEKHGKLAQEAHGQIQRDKAQVRAGCDSGAGK